MSVSRWAAVAAMVVVVPGCLAIFGAQRAEALPSTYREVVYRSDAGAVVGEGASTCQSMFIQLWWGVKTQNVEIVWEESCNWDNDCNSSYECNYGFACINGHCQ